MVILIFGRGSQRSTKTLAIAAHIACLVNDEIKLTEENPFQRITCQESLPECNFRKERNWEQPRKHNNYKMKRRRK